MSKDIRTTKFHMNSYPSWHNWMYKPTPKLFKISMARPEFMSSPDYQTTKRNCVYHADTSTQSINPLFGRYAATAPALAKHMQIRYKWTQQTHNSVNWDAHGLAVRSDIECKVHLTKLIHDVLPTNKQVSRFDKSRKPNCPSWVEPIEDRDHIIRCPHNAQKMWRSTFLTKLWEQCESIATRPQLQDILLSGLHTWFNQRSLTTKNYPGRYRKLIEDQNNIGWRQMCNRHLTSEWEALQNEYYKEIKNSCKYRLGKTWTKTITQTIWSQWQVLW